MNGSIKEAYFILNGVPYEYMESFIAVCSYYNHSLVVKAGATRWVAGHAIFDGDVIRNGE